MSIDSITSTQLIFKKSSVGFGKSFIEVSSTLYSIESTDPEATDEEKTQVIQRLDLWVKKLAAYAACPETHTIIIRLSEATFLKASDGFEIYSKAYNKKGYALAARRFKERYMGELASILKGKPIILTDWIW